MKLSDITHKSLKIFTADVLAWVFPILLIVPNIGLSITEYEAPVVKIANILLPLGIYYLISGISKATGRTVLLCLLLMIFAAFQIVLLYLYGESIIAIDMYLNVVTTNPKEATELLSNLVIAIVTILIIYIPPIVWAIYSAVKHQRSSERTLVKIRRTGAILAGAGAIALCICYISVNRYSIRRNIFPVNVMANLVEAVNRTIDTQHYFNTSSEYSYNAESTHDSNLREIYVLIVGETSRADNWELFGYGRQTNPRLSKRQNIIGFSKALSESNTTHKSVPMLLSPLVSENFGDSIHHVKGLASAFNEAGFNTAFISNQQRNHSFIDFFASQSQTVDFIKDKDHDALDGELVESMNEHIRKSPATKIFITLHCYGSHFVYRERYDDSFRIFAPDNNTEASFFNRQQLINAYDNTIIYTDAMIDNVIESLDRLDIPAAVVYVSDHGEDIFDDCRNRFLHASPTTTFTQIHVPLLVWTSDSYNRLYPEKAETAQTNRDKNVSSSRTVFNTLMSLAGISTDKYDEEADLCSDRYKDVKRSYLNDYNESVSLEDAGFRQPDFQMAEKLGIAI